MSLICMSEGPYGRTLCALDLGHEGPCGWEHRSSFAPTTPADASDMARTLGPTIDVPNLHDPDDWTGEYRTQRTVPGDDPVCMNCGAEEAPRPEPLPGLAEAVELLAAWDHRAWAGWTAYMLDRLTPENIARWRRQIETDYRDLSAGEQESDRKEARQILDVITPWLTASEASSAARIAELEQHNEALADGMRKQAASGETMRAQIEYWKEAFDGMTVAKVKAEAALTAMTASRDEYRTLAGIGAWHDQCRPNRHMAARELAKSQAVIDKLADEISAMHERLAALPKESR